MRQPLPICPTCKSSIVYPHLYWSHECYTTVWTCENKHRWEINTNATSRAKALKQPERRSASEQ